jgi:threonyl-tRNA synthetase
MVIRVKSKKSLKARVEHSIEAIRHSLAHLLALSALTIDSKAKFGVGPVIENGFYYDIQFSYKVDESILSKLEELIKKAIAQDLKFEVEKVKIAQAQKIFSNYGPEKIKQTFKLELLDDLQKYGTTEYRKIKDLNSRTRIPKVKEVTLYKIGDFLDLCRGGHIKRTSEIPPYFALTKMGGAYWRGDERKPMLTRIYGVAFNSKEELDDYLEKQKLADKYNHRVLGEELKIFLISEKVGSGLPLLLPRGEFIKQQLIEYMREKEMKYGYQYVSSPVLAYEELYEASGHKRYFGEEMYRGIDAEDKEFFVKPMNCPHHHMIYQKLVQGYKDLPLRLAEAGSVYRFERSGTLYGIMRLRGPITQNDAHIYMTKEDLEKEFRNVLQLFREVYKEINLIKDYWFRLSLPDFKGKNKDKYGGELKLWQWASAVIETAAKKEKLNFIKTEGEAAFYGPKLDVQIKNIFGKEETIATIQVDILVPKRMGLVYTDSDGKKKNPIIIHRALLGAYERFIAFLLEATRGDLPLWLSLTQVKILPINKKQLEAAVKLQKQLADNGIRSEIDEPIETLSKRILRAEKEKIPYIAVLGEKEMVEGTVSVRKRHNQNLGKIEIQKFIKELKEEAEKKI